MNYEFILKKIKKTESKIEKNRIFKKDSSFFKLKDNVFDVPTINLLSSLINKRIISEIGGTIKIGKEANIYYAKNNSQELAIKIYRTNSNSIYSKSSYFINKSKELKIKKKKDISFLLAKKEYKNLIRLYSLGLNVPKPIFIKRNILIMSFIGKNGIPYPQLHDFKVNSSETILKIFNSLFYLIRDIYQKSSLIHSDLSEYNILVDPITLNLTIIDVSQSIEKSNVNSCVFLNRDISILLNYFKKYNIY